MLYGKVGKDAHGLSYIEQMQNHGVKTRISQHQHKLTGHALTFITPDAQRTFSVHLGAAVHLEREEVLEEDVQESKILHLEGYQLEGETQETVLQAMELARKHQTLISLDLADPGVVRRNLKLLQRIVLDYVRSEGETQETVLQAMELARKHQTLISLDLADPGVVRRNLKLLQRIVLDYVRSE